jgi:formylglycine-generating enzyme required for sulfatase activity
MARLAFIWGSNGSDNFTKLKYARDDAQRIANILTTPRYGFAVSSPTRPDDPYQIKKEVDQLAKSCKKDDSFIIYFSGHGDLIAGELMLVLDGTVPDDETTYLPVSWIKEARARSIASNRLIILDCCHAGSAIGAKTSIDLVELGLASKTELMLLASRRLELARELERPKGSFVTVQTCEFLSTTSDIIVSLSKLMKYLNISAQRHNSHREKDVPNVPIPFLSGDQQGEFYFSDPPTPWIRHKINGPNGTELVVIPAYADDLAWCIGRTPVTNEQYRRFTKELGRMPPKGDIFYSLQGRRDWVPETTVADDFVGWVGPFAPWEHEEFSSPDQPVVCVSFADADAYARWLTGRPKIGPDFGAPYKQGEYHVVPLEIWDIAAFGKNFQVHDRKEWSQGKIHDKAEAPASVSDADGRTTPYGAVDMLGNVWEWCLTDVIYRKIYLDETIEVTSIAREIRGGSYLDDLSRTLPFVLTSSIADRDKCRHTDLGFRVATTVLIRDLPQEVAQRVLAGFEVRQPDPDPRQQYMNSMVTGGSVTAVVIGDITVGDNSSNNGQ